MMAAVVSLAVVAAAVIGWLLGSAGATAAEKRAEAFLLAMQEAGRASDSARTMAMRACDSEAKAWAEARCVVERNAATLTALMQSERTRKALVETLRRIEAKE